MAEPVAEQAERERKRQLRDEVTWLARQALAARKGIVLVKAAALRPGVELQKHQRDLVAKSRLVPGGQIANWRTGAGKSPGSIAVAEDRGGNTLAVVPAALRSNYRQAVEQFTTPDRHKKYTIISYEQFQKNPHGWIARTNPSTVVADEFHRLRNNGKARQAFESVRDQIPYLLGNTASLVNNRPEELVPLVNLAAGHKVYDSEADFARRHLGKESVRGPGLGGLLRARGEREKLMNADELKKRIGPYVHRFNGDTGFSGQFPEVTEQMKTVDLTKRQQDLTKAVLKANPDLAYKIKMNLPPNKRDLKSLNSFSVALRQISNNPAEFDTSVVDKLTESPKFRAMLHEQEQMAKSDPHFRAVVYSNFLSSGVQPVVEGAKQKGLSAELFQGGMGDKERADMVKRFNRGHIKTLGLSPAGGEGLDLKGVKLIQLAEGHWNPERAKQAIGRGVRFKSHAHLPQKERKVVVQKFVAKNPRRWWHNVPGVHPDTSIDQWIESRRDEKERLNQQFVKAIG